MTPLAGWSKPRSSHHASVAPPVAQPPEQYRQGRVMGSHPSCVCTHLSCCSSLVVLTPGLCWHPRLAAGMDTSSASWMVSLHPPSACAWSTKDTQVCVRGGCVCVVLKWVSASAYSSALACCCRPLFCGHSHTMINCLCLLCACPCVSCVCVCSPSPTAAAAARWAVRPRQPRQPCNDPGCWQQ